MALRINSRCINLIAVLIFDCLVYNIIHLFRKTVFTFIIFFIALDVIILVYNIYSRVSKEVFISLDILALWSFIKVII